MTELTPSTPTAAPALPHLTEIQHAAAVIQARLSVNPAANAYHTLRQVYARHTVQAARARLLGDAPGRGQADHDRARVTRVAHALLLGLAVQGGTASEAASAAASLLVAQAFNTHTLICGPASEPHAVYVDERPAQPQHAAWVLCQASGWAAYLLSPSEHRRLVQDTGRCPRLLI